MSRNRIAILTTIALLLGGGNALAENPLSQQISITGSVNPIGTMGAPTFSGTNNASPVNSNISIPSLATDTLTPKYFEFTATFPITINASARIKVFSTNGCLKTDGASTNSDFVNYIPYTARAYVGEDNSQIAESTLTADGSSNSSAKESEHSDQFGQYNGNLTLIVGSATITNPKKLISGEYSDTLTVKVGSTL